jgi:hypothetical protein
MQVIKHAWGRAVHKGDGWKIRMEIYIYEDLYVSGRIILKWAKEELETEVRSGLM